jgi:hypothetical protein
MRVMIEKRGRKYFMSGTNVEVDEPMKIIDKRCQRKYGHDNWVRVETVSDEVLSRNSHDYDEKKGIVYFHKPFIKGE